MTENKPTEDLRTNTCNYPTNDGGECNNKAGEGGTCYINSHDRDVDKIDDTTNANTPETADSTRTTSDDYEQKRAELIERTKERKQSLTEEQDAILDDIQQEHGGELIETTCRITPTHTVDVSVDLNGEFIDKMGEIEDLNDRIESGETMASGTSEVMDKTSQLLADAVDDPEWTKDLFYQVYRENEPKALGELFGNIADAVKAERKRKAGTVNGFRKK